MLKSYNVQVVTVGNMVGCCSLFTWIERNMGRGIEEELRAWGGFCCHDGISGGRTGVEGVLPLTPASLWLRAKLCFGCMIL